METAFECMCTQCGISIFLTPPAIHMDDPTNARGSLMENTFCSLCGGPLILVGRAGDEPFYRTG
ncbi:MAG: hypothetical protein GX443_12635 [Deltaproteobacteria bacterium]|nr:hypothetical protein [Deltaproteobacteria bacterium]